MVYSPEMTGLLSPRPHAVTGAALLAILTGCYWLVFGALFDELYREATPPHVRGRALAWLVFSVTLGVAIATSGVALLFRRNWGRIFALLLTAPCLLGCFSFIGPFFSLPARLWPPLLAPWIFPIAAAVAWTGLLAGQNVRMELLPPATIKIYVNLLAEGSGRSVDTKAVALGRNLFKLLPNGSYNQDEQHWEIVPGSVVRVIKKRRDGERYLLAVPLRPD
jgi:hypothetical protein